MSNKHKNYLLGKNFGVSNFPLVLYHNHEQVGEDSLVWNYTWYMSFSCSYVYQCTVFLKQALSTKTVTLEVIQPFTGSVCPGQEVILTCTVTQTGAVTETLLQLRNGSTTVLYDSANQESGAISLDSFITTAVFMITTNSAVIVSNATLTSATLSNNNTIISCLSPLQDNIQIATIIVAGMIIIMCMMILS